MVVLIGRTVSIGAAIEDESIALIPETMEVLNLEWSLPGAFSRAWLSCIYVCAANEYFRYSCI